MKHKPGVVLFCLAVALGSAHASDPALVDVQVVRDGEEYLASGRVEQALTPELLEEISAGIETTISYRLEVLRRRRGLPDQTIVKWKLRHTVRKDALTRQYSLVRWVDGEVQETRVTDEESAMQEFMTVLDSVPIARAEDLPPGEEYYLKAKANIGLVWRFYLIPWPLATDWVRVELDTPESQASEPNP
jgi:hypothetical protein